jgi:hypothetical protein
MAGQDFHAQHTAAERAVGSRHLLEAGHVRLDQVVREVHEERFVPDHRARAQHRVPEPERRRLADVDARDVARQHAAQLVRERALALRLQQALERLVGVEVVLDGALGGAGHEYQTGHARGDRLLDRILDQRLVDDRQHLLRTRLGGRQKPRAATCHGKYRRTDLAPRHAGVPRSVGLQAAALSRGSADPRRR